MKYRVVSVLKDNRPRFLIISDIEEIEILPSKYLKHLDQINASPNTVKSAAFALSYYYNYLQKQTIGLDEITLLSYSEQNKHFIDFLYWVKSGKHTEHNTQTSNKTCNMYLGAVFRYYQFLALEDVLPMLKVLRVKKVSYFDSMGVNHQNAVNSFKGFFKEEEHNLEEITSEEIQELINACTNDRDRLLIAMMAETGLRLGEILGIHYTEDIDFERRTVRVRYRESNTNLARAKNAEYRMALLSNTTFEFLVKYISDNRKSLMNSEYLFTKLTGKNKGEPLDADSVYSMLKRLSKKTDINSHPHMNNAGTIAVVHNGIIENYIPLKKKMQDKGYQFVSETDTEVLAHLLDYYYKGNPLEAITKVLHRVEGSYALGIMFADQPDKIFAARKDSPLIVGKSDNGSFIASDVPAILKYTRTVYYVDNQEVVELQQGSLRFFSVDEEEIEKQPVTIDWDANAAEKAGYEHFMLKEIYEQPKTINDTISPRIKDNDIVIEELNMSDEEIKEITKIHIVACGSAYHTGVTAKYVIEGLARIPVEVDVASEFRYRDPILQKGNMVIVISQSGETADTLAALRESRERGFKVLGIVNVVGSSIAREADSVMYTWAGPEIAVATTKAYSAQLTALYMLAMKFARVRGTIDQEKFAGMLTDLRCLPDQIELLLGQKEKIQHFANRYVGARDIFFIGRGIDYAISLEGSLKLKEISYIHSEAYAAGELKHGTISLIEDGTLVVALATQPDLFQKTISNMVEVKARGAFVMAVTIEGNKAIEKASDYVIYIPETNPYFTNSLAIIPLQLFSYYVAVGRGCDVDKPRNLAKSVTVE